MGSNLYIAKHSMQSLCEQRLPGGAEETNKAKQFRPNLKKSVTLSQFKGTTTVPLFFALSVPG